MSDYGLVVEGLKDFFLKLYNLNHFSAGFATGTVLGSFMGGVTTRWGNHAVVKEMRREVKCCEKREELLRTQLSEKDERIEALHTKLEGKQRRK